MSDDGNVRGLPGVDMDAVVQAATEQQAEQAVEVTEYDPTVRWIPGHVGQTPTAVRCESLTDTETGNLWVRVTLMQPGGCMAVDIPTRPMVDGEVLGELERQQLPEQQRPPANPALHIGQMIVEAARITPVGGLWQP